MSNSYIGSVSVNHKYVVVQAESNSTGGNLYNFTWVFTRGSRIFSNAYAVISHLSFRTFVDFNREFSLIMSIDEDNIQLWEINSPRMMIAPHTDTQVGHQSIFSIVGYSVNPVTNRNLTCTFSYKMVVVASDNYTTWPTGLTPSREYYANYPGELFIPLNRYVLGPNITWGVEENTTKGELPSYWILQQNESVITWETKLNLGKITFLRQEQYDSVERTYIFMYLQDIYNKTVYAECTT